MPGNSKPAPYQYYFADYLRSRFAQRFLTLTEWSEIIFNPSGCQSRSPSDAIANSPTSSGGNYRIRSRPTTLHADFLILILITDLTNMETGFISLLDLVNMTDAERVRYLQTDEVLPDPMDISLEDSYEVSFDEEISVCTICGLDQCDCWYLPLTQAEIERDNGLFTDITNYF